MRDYSTLEHTTMGKDMNHASEEELRAMATELAKGVKSQEDLNSITSELVKLTVEAALGAEMEAHLGVTVHSPTWLPTV